MTCQNKVGIVQGEDRSFIVKLSTCSSNEETNDPFDLTSVTAIKAIFKGANNTNVEITLLATEIVIVGSPVLGKLQLKLSDTKTALLKTGENQTFEIELTIGTDIRIVKVKGLLSVYARG